MTNNKIHIQKLAPESLPLSGCHLIEASAGTGKTYNITRIYLRLLLEKKLDVKHILVMTFTRAATEELRARIGQEIRHALENWQILSQADNDDNFFKELTQRFCFNDVKVPLHNALLHLDEAAIFTIHGFCKRVLSQYAFSSGTDFTVQMEHNTYDLELDSVRDWYRVLAHQNFAHETSSDYHYLSTKWPTPEQFHRAFQELFASNVNVQSQSVEAILAAFAKQKQHALEQLQQHQGLVFEHLIDSHKQKETRAKEWDVLIQWLTSDGLTNDSGQQEGENKLWAMPKDAVSVFDRRHFSRKDLAIREQLDTLFTPLKQLQKDLGKLDKLLLQAKSNYIACQGIAIIRKKIAAAKEQQKVMNFDDLIHQLAQALSTENTLVDQIRTQYPIALVDEFQDTDPQQYAILKALYLNSLKKAPKEKEQDNYQLALYMIGDPKQAIYAFRSGDVFTYLSARNDADQQWLMDTNWRSSTAMINAYNRLFYGASLNNKKPATTFKFGIDYSPVKSAGKADLTPLQIDATIGTEHALQLVSFAYQEAFKISSSNSEMKQSFYPIIASWCAREIHNLLTHNTRIGERSIQAQDIAILVRDKTEAAYLSDALNAINYSSVYLSAHDSVFASEEATELEQALTGILELENERFFIAALATHYFACDSKQLLLIHEDENQWELFRVRLIELRDIWLKRGFMAMALMLIKQQDEHSYCPNSQQHERSLTNTIHLFELLQQASQQYQQPEQLLNYLREQIQLPQNMPESELRLESDANLIRIITQHGAKGLEYPIVFIPFATRYKDPTKFGSKTIDLFKYHNRDDYLLNYFIGKNQAVIDLYREEAYAESIRLLYVAITRAQYRCYLCVAPFKDSHLSSLGQTLQLAKTKDLDAKLSLLVTSEPMSIAKQSIDAIEFPLSGKSYSETLIDAAHYEAQVFTGKIERNWWLSSFSALTKNLRHGGLSLPDRDRDAVAYLSEEAIALAQTVRFTLTKGAAAGNLLHDILEHCDFSAPLSAPLWQQNLARPLSRYNESLDSTQQEELIAWLKDCLQTPLPNGPKLNDLCWPDTLRESEFYFPMQGVPLDALSSVLARHRQQRYQQSAQAPEQSHLPPKIVQLGQQTLTGMMHGFIDLIFHWQGRYYVVDYKSTYLGDQLDAYNQAALDKNVADNYYDMQYLLYSLALHRYLKNRLDDYDADKHFGGVYYLYLRGMSAHSDTGIFTTTISSHLLQELDYLFSSQSVSDAHANTTKRKEV